MTLRFVFAVALLGIGMGCSRMAQAQERWVDDERVLAARRVRLSAGVGVAWSMHQTFSKQTYALAGTGLNLEEAVGLGHGFEFGARFGMRPDNAGRGLRADEVARGFDTETFGTGLSIVANPELRLRWRAARWTWGEGGLENRMILPIKPDPDVTELLGAWASVRGWHILRVDAGFNAVLKWQSFTARYVVQPSFGIPVQLWINPTRALFFGLMTTTHYVAATPYTATSTRLMTGLGAGVRVQIWDITAATYLADVLHGLTSRGGFGIDLACRM